jgi:hypothetical protein
MLAFATNIDGRYADPPMTCVLPAFAVEVPE